MTAVMQDEVRTSQHNALGLRKLRIRSLLTIKFPGPSLVGARNGGCAFPHCSRAERSPRWGVSRSSPKSVSFPGGPFDGRRTSMHAVGLSAHYFLVGLS